MADVGETEENDSQDDSSTQDDDDESEDVSAVPHLDEDEKTYRCTTCFWEVVDGMCQHCFKRFGDYDDESVRVHLDSLRVPLIGFVGRRVTSKECRNRQ